MITSYPTQYLVSKAAIKTPFSEWHPCITQRSCTVLHSQVKDRLICPNMRVLCLALMHSHITEGQSMVISNTGPIPRDARFQTKLWRMYTCTTTSIPKPLH